jgi:hypothetical protein
MKKLLTITTLLILTNPYIHSADWISDNLPKNRQVDPIYRDIVKLIQERTGTSTPIIFVNENDGNAASVLNIGAGPCRFALMSINQRYLQNTSIHSNLKTLAHETGHIDQNHGGVDNGLYFTGIGMIGSSPLLKIAQYARSTPLRAGRTLALGLSLTTAELLCNIDKKPAEHEADEIAFKKLSQLGLCDTLEALSNDYAIMAELNIPRSEIYPPYTQMHEWAKKTTIECQENEKKYHIYNDHIMK